MGLTEVDSEGAIDVMYVEARVDIGRIFGAGLRRTNVDQISRSGEIPRGQRASFPCRAVLDKGQSSHWHGIDRTDLAAEDGVDVSAIHLGRRKESDFGPRVRARQHMTARIQ